MSRRVSFVMLIALVLSACALPGGAPAPGGAISFMVSGDAAEKAAYEQLVNAFQQREPRVTVTLIHVPGDSDYRKRLGVDFAAGTPADIILLNYRRYAPFASRDALEPLGPYLARSALIAEKDFYDEALAPFRWQGVLMCIPQNISSLVVYYNRSMFQAAGLADPTADWTWDDFVQTARALTRDLDGDGQIDQYGIGSTVSLLRAAPFIWQNGGDLVDNPAAPTRLTIDEPAAREAIQWFVDLQVKEHVAPDAVAEAAESSESRFLNGRLGMFLNSRRGTPTYRTIGAFDWDVAPLPRGVSPAGVLHSDAYCLPRASANKEAAWAFIEFANSPEGQRIIATTGRTVPSLRAVAESPAFLDPQSKPTNSRVFLDVVPYVRSVPVMATWVDIEDLVSEELERAFYGQASVDEAIGMAIERSKPFFGNDTTAP